jgi:hypothetical protein
VYRPKYRYAMTATAVVSHAGSEYHLSEPRVEKRDDDQSDPEPGGSEQASRPDRSLAGGRGAGRTVA